MVFFWGGSALLLLHPLPFFFFLPFLQHTTNSMLHDNHNLHIYYSLFTVYFCVILFLYFLYFQLSDGRKKYIFGNVVVVGTRMFIPPQPQCDIYYLTTFYIILD